MAGKYDHINFLPPEGAKTEAARGLAWRKKHGRGGTQIGIARARDIRAGKRMSPSTVRRMKNFFDRHAVDRNSKGFRPGEDGYPSNGRIAHALWGGSPGYSFARKVVKQMDTADKRAAARQKKKAPRRERRFIESATVAPLTIETRQQEDGSEESIVRGTAVVFGSESRDLGGFTEVISPTSLDRFFERHGGTPDVAALWNHDTGEVLGRTPRTLKLHRDRDGLHFELSLPKSRPEVLEAVARQDVRGASFAFTVAKGGEAWAEDRSSGKAVRTVNEIDELFEISLVLQPAYEATSVSVAKRHLTAWKRKRTKAKRAKEQEAEKVREHYTRVVASLKHFVEGKPDEKR